MPDRLTVAACERIVVAATKSCAAPVPQQVTASIPAKATTADALSGLAVALAYATLGLAIVALAAGIGWLFYVRHRTKIAAREEAERVVPEQVRAYLDEKVPGMVAEAIAVLGAGPGRSPGGGTSAEEQAQDLGSEPG